MSDIDKVEYNKKYRDTDDFKFNHQVMVDRCVLDSYRMMVKGSNPEGSDFAKSTLNHFRFILAGFSEKDDFYLKHEVLMKDWEIAETRLWGELVKRKEELNALGEDEEVREDGAEYYNPDDYIDKGLEW